jgi:hypothetical protein
MSDAPTFFIRPSEKNPTHRPSGEKNGLDARSVPGSGRIVELFRDRK